MHFFLQRTHALVRKVGKRRERRRGKDPKEVRLPCDRDAKAQLSEQNSLGDTMKASSGEIIFELTF